jgi:riboflavin kinase/FMN adenylyltransferase
MAGFGIRTVVVPGNHDGVHRGHRSLIDLARREAERLGAETRAMFFSPHPAHVLAPERAPVALTTPERRRELLLAAGADSVAVETFDHAFAQLSPAEFVDRILAEKHRARAVVVGPDFKFGKGRAGNLETLRELGARHGIEAIVASPVLETGERISSSLVRERLRIGDVTRAAALLGRVHESEAVVVHGQKLGRTLGFPTANLAPVPTLLPKDGIYAVVARALNEPGAPLWRGVASLGERPTVTAGRALEVHLFDVDPDLYGKPLRVGWVRWIRGEEKFADLESLKRAISSDVVAARQAVSEIREDQLRWI